MKTLKTDLANWLVNENSDCGRDTYFNDDLRGAMSIEDSYKKFMRENTKDDLITLIYDHSEDGQRFLEDNNLVR